MMETMATMYARPKPIWAIIEILYTQTDTSVRRIADLHGISHTAIQKRAARRGWVKFHPPADATPSTLIEDVPSVPLPRSRLEPEPHNGAATLETVKQSGPQRLLEHARGLVEALLGELDAAIAHKNMRSPSRALAAKSLAGAAKLLIDASVGRPLGKKEQQQAIAEELARTSPFAMRALPPKALPGVSPIRKDHEAD
jgi:hypothetical protein